MRDLTSFLQSSRDPMLPPRSAAPRYHATPLTDERPRPPSLYRISTAPSMQQSEFLWHAIASPSPSTSIPPLTPSRAANVTPYASSPVKTNQLSHLYSWPCFDRAVLTRRNKWSETIEQPQAAATCRRIAPLVHSVRSYRPEPSTTATSESDQRCDHGCFDAATFAGIAPGNDDFFYKDSSRLCPKVDDSRAPQAREIDESSAELVVRRSTGRRGRTSGLERSTRR